jgi:hypothetical protein
MACGRTHFAPVRAAAFIGEELLYAACHRPDGAVSSMTVFRRSMVTLAVGASLLGFFASAAESRPAGPYSIRHATSYPVAHTSSYPIGQKVLDKAETQTGCWYGYGHAGPCGYGYDCSGLVYWAAHRLGVNLPRTTYGIMSSSAVYRIRLSSARRGDLMFYGSGHVEINTRLRSTTFGALHTGTRIGWHRWNAYWHPTMAFRIRSRR